MLIGNKCDMHDKRQVSRDKGEHVRTHADEPCALGRRDLDLATTDACCAVLTARQPDNVSLIGR